MRVIHPEYSDTLINPEIDDAFEFFPEFLPFFGFEVERINVFIFLGWVFGILDGAIRTQAKPFGVFMDTGMVRRTLEGQI